MQGNRIKVGVIIPTRGDRPEFFAHAKYLLERQTLQPSEVCFVDYPPKSSRPDITERYKFGFNQLRDKVHVIAPMEDDDWYAPFYLNRFSRLWNVIRNKKKENIDLLGINEHLVYHIIGRRYGTLRHQNKAPMSNTLIRAEAPIRWPASDYIFTDIHLWNNLKGRTIDLPYRMSISIKHGTGFTCTPTHKQTWQHYYHADHGMELLQKIVDKKSYEFYRDFAFRALHPAV